MNVVIAVAGIALAGGVVTWFLLTRRVSENAADHGVAARDTPNEMYYDSSHRTAGADVEPMDPELLGGDQSAPRVEAPDE